MEDDEDDIGWVLIGEKALREIWDNKKDKKIWTKYLRNKYA